MATPHQKAVELQVQIAGRKLPLSVVGRLYEEAKAEGLNNRRYFESVALWNAMIRSDKASKGIRLERYSGPTITASRLDELLAGAELAQLQQGAA